MVRRIFYAAAFEGGLRPDFGCIFGKGTSRFALHILPKRFVKIRHYGFLSSSWKREKLKKLQKQLGVKPKVKIEKEQELPICSCCGHGRMHIVAVFHERGPPIWLDIVDENINACGI